MNSFHPVAVRLDYRGARPSARRALAQAGALRPTQSSTRTGTEDTPISAEPGDRIQDTWRPVAMCSIFLLECRRLRLRDMAAYHDQGRYESRHRNRRIAERGAICPRHRTYAARGILV